MTQFGITPAGFRRKTLAEIVAEMEADELATIANDLDVSPDQLVGQFNGIVGRQASICWEQLEGCYNGNDPDVAESRLLEAICKLTGTFRRGSTPSTVTLTCDLDVGTVLKNGEAFAAIEDHGDIRWTPRIDYTATSTGLQPVSFVSELKGPIQGFAGTINVIAPAVVGWRSCVNADDAELGIEIDTDPLLRIRREQELATIGSATVRAMLANIADAFPNLEALAIYENENDLPDATGLPGHSIEVLIFDGLVPTIVDDVLAQVIQDNKAGGTGTFGNVTAHATVTMQGISYPREVRFSRAAQVPIWIEIDLVKNAKGYPGDLALAQSVATQANARYTPGRSVAKTAIESFPFAFAGVERVTAVRLGLAPSPVGTVDIPISQRQIARFSSSRVLVTST